jgi:hypothetical protein
MKGCKDLHNVQPAQKSFAKTGTGVWLKKDIPLTNKASSSEAFLYTLHSDIPISPLQYWAH